MLKHFMVLAGIAALAWAAISQAHAQPYRGRGPSATLYDRPNFEGRQVTITGDVANLSNYNFNDRTHSLRLQGRWRLCEHSDFGGRCVELTGDVPELNTVAMAERITSIEPVGGGGGRPGPGPFPGGGGGYGRGERGVEGHNTVFFPRPTVRGLDVAAGSNGANVFCREQGLGPAAHFDSSQRAGRAIGPEGQVTGPSSVLRDLLCRKS
ncbi:beta/gamma crystallin-related protein [Phenylobacterium sp.]|jgi:hypothetical protein|uniref:beta/gamma crystallin-related protein n=1 Tax=Phenylobacterium sp. TaxID=1871053 RepID=UPI002F95E2C3